MLKVMAHTGADCYEYCSEHWRPVSSTRSERDPRVAPGGRGLPLAVKIGMSGHGVFLMIAAIVHW